MTRTPVNPAPLKQSYDAWGFSPAVLSGDFLFIGGQVGIKSDGTIPTDPSAQMEQAFINMGSILESVGASFDDVVDLTAFYTNYPEHSSLARPVRDQFFGINNTPNWTAIGVAALAEPFVFEVKAIVRIPEQ